MTRFVISEMPKNNTTRGYAKIRRDMGYYVLLEDHGLYYDVLVTDQLPAKVKYVEAQDELHKLDS